MPTKILGIESVFETGKFRAILNKETGAVVVIEKESGKIVASNKDIKTKSKTTSYLITFVVMAAIGLLAFIFISAGRPSADLLGIGGIVFAFVATATLQIVNFIKAEEIKTETAEAKVEAASANAQTVITHALVNSSYTVALENAVKVGIAEGMKIGRHESELRADQQKQLQSEIKIQEAIAIPPTPVPPIPKVE